MALCFILPTITWPITILTFLFRNLVNVTIFKHCDTYFARPLQLVQFVRSLFSLICVYSVILISANKRKIINKNSYMSSRFSDARDTCMRLFSLSWRNFCVFFLCRYFFVNTSCAFFCFVLLFLFTTFNTHTHNRITFFICPACF